MLPLNVPLLPEPGYVDFLRRQGSRLQAVHFSLQEPALCDARVRLDQVGEQVGDQVLVDQLTRLPGVRKYLLANGRFQPRETYMGDAGRHLIHRLERLLEEGALDGIIFADAYLLRFLGDRAGQLAGRLEAVPSVNFMIDEAGKLAALLELVSSCGFLPPAKIPLDRSLNRNPRRLERLSAELRRRWPELQIELLANEGCLPHCPFRASHEALIAAANSATAPEGRIDTRRLNAELACQRTFHEQPQRLLSSPFIRPEDVGAYEKSADLLKICGRTLGREFLERAVEAYGSARYDGNLLDLLDACHWMAADWYLDNARLPADFQKLLSSCRSDCGSCQVCSELFRQLARPRPIRLPDWRRAAG